MNSMVVKRRGDYVQMNILLTFVHHNDRFIRFTAVSWVYELILVDEDWLIPYARILRSLLPCYEDNESEVREKAVTTCNELIKSVREKKWSHQIVANKRRKSGFGFSY